MRFRKRLRIAKGLYVNLSKSGPSLTVGHGGLSMNFGSKGTFLNTGIPGTGLYNRQRIGGSSGVSSKPAANTKTTIECSISLDENGKPLIKDFYGDIIHDESLLRKIKRTEEYKSAVERLSLQMREEIEGKCRSIEDIFKLSPAVIKRIDIESQLNKLRFVGYIKGKYVAIKPDLESCRYELEQRAKQEIKSIFFWTNKRKRDEFVENQLSSFFEEKLKTWESDKIKYETAEEEKRIEEDARRMSAYEKHKSELERQLRGSSEYVSEVLENYLKDISLPVDFSIDYEYDFDKELLLVDLDLPEIESMPQEKASTLSSGKLSIKNKTGKELNHDYTRCVTGLAFFFTSFFFNISPKIATVMVSGYTQRISKKTGNMENVYIYSVIFERERFEKLNVQNIDPIDAIRVFRNRMDITSTFDMKEIAPFTSIMGFDA